MARINKSALTKMEITAEASKQFLEKGYHNTTLASIAKELGMSHGNLTFHFPTKDLLLAVLVDLLCDFQWNSMKKEINDDQSPILSICLELAAMVSLVESDEVARDFFLSSYTTPICLDMIRRNDAKRAKEIYRAYRPDWSDQDFIQAEVLVSGIEYATFMAVGDPVPTETRIAGALHGILNIFGVPEEIRNPELEKVFAMDYKAIGKRVLADFKNYVAEANDQAFYALLKR